MILMAPFRGFPQAATSGGGWVTDLPSSLQIPQSIFPNGKVKGFLSMVLKKCPLRWLYPYLNGEVRNLNLLVWKIYLSGKNQEE